MELDSATITVALIGINEAPCHDVQTLSLCGTAYQIASTLLEAIADAVEGLDHARTWKNRSVALTVTEFLILQAIASRSGVVKADDAQGPCEAGRVRAPWCRPP
jgi:hypothetical protein